MSLRRATKKVNGHLKILRIFKLDDLQDAFKPATAYAHIHSSISDRGVATHILHLG